MCLDLDEDVYFTGLSFRYDKQPAVYCVFLKDYFVVSYDIYIKINLDHLRYLDSFRGFSFGGDFSLKQNKNTFYLMDLARLVYSRSRHRSRSQNILGGVLKQFCYVL